MARTRPRANAATVTTTPFDVGAWIQEEENHAPGFAAAVENELASLRIEDRIRDLRKSRHMTQAQLAKRMGVSQGAIAQMESAEPGSMAIRTLAKMATALGYGLKIDFEPHAVADDRVTQRPRASRKR